MPWYVGADVGCTNLRAALVNERGEVRNLTRGPTSCPGGFEAVAGQVAGIVEELSRGEDIRGVGIGFAGQCQEGVVRFSPNLRWTDKDLGGYLRRHIGVPVAILNDVRAATCGEWRLGAGKGCRDLVCLFVGTGIGGGAVINGRLLMGSRDAAGEFGHMTVDMHGPLCGCGNRGCLEAIAGGWAIARRAREAVEACPALGRRLVELSRGGEITAAMVAVAAHEGDPLALDLVEGTGEALVAGAVSLVNALNPRRMILGGGVIDGLPELVKVVEEGVRERAMGCAAEELEVVRAALGDAAGLVGAVSFLRHQLGER